MMFLFCNSGQEVSTAFEEINDEIYQCNWQEFPLKIQRMFPIIMIVAQGPVYIESTGSFVCNRETFNKVNKINNFRFVKIFIKVNIILYYYDHFNCRFLKLHTHIISYLIHFTNVREF